MSTTTDEPASGPFLATSSAIAELRPELFEGMVHFVGLMREHRRLPERLVELVRLRIAFRNQCRPCMSMRYDSALQDGLTEAMVCSLETPDEPSDLTPAERAAVRFGDTFASDHLGLTVADRLSLNAHFTPDEIAELALLVMVFTGFGRFGAVFDTGESYPVGERRDDGALLTPWGVANPMTAEAGETRLARPKGNGPSGS